MVSEVDFGGVQNENRTVLILIVLEYGLGEGSYTWFGMSLWCLNPYCAGIWSILK